MNEAKLILKTTTILASNCLRFTDVWNLENDIFENKIYYELNTVDHCFITTRASFYFNFL